MTAFNIVNSYNSIICSSYLLQIILKIARNMFVQMYPILPCHVVPVPRVNEEIGMCACFDARFQKLQAVLQHHRGIFVAMDDKQARFQPVRFV